MEFKISPGEYRKLLEGFIEERNQTLSWETKFPAFLKIEFPPSSAMPDGDFDKEGILTFSVSTQNERFMASLIPYIQISLLRFTYEFEVSEKGGVDPGHQILKRQFQAVANDLKARLAVAKRQSNALADTYYLPHSAIHRLMPCLCYTERNREFLSSHPHREVADLSIYYRVQFTPRQMDAFQESFSNSVGGFAVSNNMLSEWKKDPEYVNLEEKGLYEITRENAVRDSRSEILTIGDRSFLMLTNEQGYYGTAFAFTGLTEKDVRSFVGESECLILPLSVHEALIYPAGKDDVGTVMEAFHKYMEEEIREIHIRRPFLPGNVYHLDAHTGKISVYAWGDTSPKQAEGIITESDVLLVRQSMHPRR